MGNLSLSEAIMLKPGDLLIYSPSTSKYPVPVDVKELTPDTVYTLVHITVFGIKEGVIQEFSKKDLEHLTVTDEWGKPLTNVPLRLDGVLKERSYCFFKKK